MDKGKKKPSFRETIRRIGSVAKEEFKKSESQFGRNLRKPLSPREIALAKSYNSGAFDTFLGADPFGSKPQMKTSKHRHEFVVNDFRSGKLKCKYCGMTVTAKDLGKRVGKRIEKKQKPFTENTVDFDDVLGI